MSVKDDIAAGPKWNDGLRRLAGDVVDARLEGDLARALSMPQRPCAACGGLDWTDTETGLCRPCWRAWRWASECHCDECCNDAVIAASVAEELAEAKP